MSDGDIIWQRMFYLRGYAAILEDLLLDREHCTRLRDMILGVMVPRVERLCQIPDLDAIHFRDDWGTQEALMISPGLWREFFKPAYAQLFGMTRAAGKHVWFHSDGAIGSIVPDLIEIGVQVLNPQVDAIGRENLARMCAGKITILADIDRQTVLPYGTPEQVREEVRADIAAFGSHGGGYIGRGEIAGDVPLENVIALLDEISRH
jgi:uroporphyrinogen decarboxylase